MKMKLGVRLFLSYLIVIMIGVVVLFAVAQISLPGAYGRHMVDMMADSGDSMGMMGRGQGQGVGGGEGPGLYANFRASFYEALGWAGLAAGVVALCASVLVSRQLAAPIRAMTAASARISEGNYAERVPVTGSDEIGQLAGSFNRMAGKLEQTESMRRQLLGDVAHELRTPLTAIKGSMEGLMDGVLPATGETFEQIHAEADRLSRLVDDLQELSRVEAHAFRLDLMSVSVVDLCAATRKRLQHQFDEKGVGLIIDLPASLPFVLADADRIGQVLINLVGNALQYTPPGGCVTLSAERREREVWFSVADTGIGILPEHLPHVFDRFYRADKSRSRRSGGGSGIGLTIARALVEAHGGTIRVESAGADQGSCFTFTLPCTPDLL